VSRRSRALLRLPALLYRWNLGWLLGRRFLLLRHVGRRSGQIHETVLEVIGTRPAEHELIVLAALGRSAQWYRNLQARPAAEVVVGRSRFRPAHRTLDEGEAAAVLADFERRNRLAGPLVRYVLGRLAGWPYDGSEQARGRLVRQLPVVAFRPAADPADQMSNRSNAGGIARSEDAARRGERSPERGECCLARH
jgi:deazaflavin-dependent oxidoreductase (nitroreductase family)